MVWLMYDWSINNHTFELLLPHFSNEAIFSATLITFLHSILVHIFILFQNLGVVVCFPIYTWNKYIWRQNNHWIWSNVCQVSNTEVLYPCNSLWTELLQTLFLCQSVFVIYVYIFKEAQKWKDEWSGNLSCQWSGLYRLLFLTSMRCDVTLRSFSHKSGSVSLQSYQSSRSPEVSSVHGRLHSIKSHRPFWQNQLDLLNQMCLFRFPPLI